MTMLEAALRYAARGWHVFPVTPRAKDPPLVKWKTEATTDPAKIREYWQQPDCNIAIRAGEPSGVWILDVDVYKSDAAFRALERQYGPLPPTLTAITCRGGLHRYFVHPGHQIQTLTNKIGKTIAVGIDVRGDGGYALLPPSRAEGGIYRWADGPTQPVRAPRWLEKMARKPTITEQALATVVRPHFPIAAGGTAYGRAALNSDVTAFAAMQPETGRNARLNSISFRLHGLVATGELDGAEVKRRLFDAAIANGLVRDTSRYAVLKTIESGARAGLQQPRYRKKS